MEKYDFTATVYTAEPNRSKIDGFGTIDFAIDFATVDVPKNPVPVDFNHDETRPIGSATVTVGTDKIEAVGALVSTRPNDLAASIAENARAIPYGVSPLFDLRDAERINVSDGDVFPANGRVYEGPISIFRRARLIGVAVCLHPPDISTTFTPLSTNERFLIMPKQKETIAVADPVADPAAEPVAIAEPVACAIEKVGIVPVEPERAGDETGVPETGVKNRELQDFIDLFGLDRGVRLYQEGQTIDDARRIAFDELKRENAELKAKIAELEAVAAAKPEPVAIAEPVAQSVESAVPTPPADPDPEPKPADALALALDKFETVVSKLDETAAALSLLGRRGDAVGVSGSTPAPVSKTYRDAFRDALTLKQ